MRSPVCWDVGFGLVHGDVAFGGGGGLVALEEEGEEDHAESHPEEHFEDVDVALHAGLALEFSVDGAHGHSAAVGAAEVLAEEAADALGVLVKGDVGGGHLLLEEGLVVHGLAGDERAGDGDEDGAADVADEVDEAGDLIALFARGADVGGGGDGDEAEGDG